MQRRTTVIAGVMAITTVVVVGLVVFTLRRTPPPIPPDPDHRSAFAVADCLVCHGPAGGRPRGRNHPLNDRCFDCHARG